MNLKSHLQSLKVKELREICKKSGIIGISNYKKAALVEMMFECDLKGCEADEGSDMEVILEEEPCSFTLEDCGPLAVEGVCICDELGCDKCEDAEEIILHLPINVIKLDKPPNYDKALTRGKLILEKLEC